MPDSDKTSRPDSNATAPGTRLDESRPFIPVNIAVLTVSDTRTAETDRSGDTLVERLTAAGHVLADRAIVRDDVGAITERLSAWIADDGIDVVISTGGTGVTGRDVTPEAFESVYEKRIEGFGEAFRWISFQKIGTSAMQSRATAGVAHGTYLFAVPGSTGACRDAWDEIFAYQLDFRFRPCNFVEIMPRLREHEMAREKTKA
ncbi:molybdenum cofactor biosynthesis protein B [Thalassobaculum sp. OXR-137]|uniref:molybdenum cofactor biosynthesis protein B n=1 Tax=Thalassobaculum sp. OXR-137 TaxID=3100173 RepID=UPI002AC8FA87|nr:molybdenum cofactor biosynthesis protein B [Thalassobaculum sp. OXR-137]WPZ35452.1 molybdenum cofactor biosynthesis protein B [Thalassobaculum sp. OXR-137]